MYRRFRKFVERFLRKNLEDYYGGPLHRLEKAAAKQSKDALRFAAEAERGRLPEGREPPTIVPQQPRRSAKEERRRIDDMPIP